MSLLTLQCLNPNPDIAGIGVRVSIYVQAFLTLVPVILFCIDGKITCYEREVLDKIYASLLLTACALLVSAFVQAATIGLSVYHAIIVLNLSWIINVSALAWFLVDLSRKLREDGARSFVYLWRKYKQGGIVPRWAQCKQFDLLPLILSIAHLCGMASLGTWVWSGISTFGLQPECTRETLTIVFGHAIPVTSTSLRTISIVLYSITVVPGINLLVFTILAFICAAILARIVWSIHRVLQWVGLVSNNQKTQSPPNDECFLSGVMLIALLDILLIVDTELMMTKNTDMVKPGEADWSFGQTLAMLMIVLPLFEVAKQCWEWYRNGDEGVHDLDITTIPKTHQCLMPSLPPGEP